MKCFFCDKPPIVRFMGKELETCLQCGKAVCFDHGMFINDEDEDDVIECFECNKKPHFIPGLSQMVRDYIPATQMHIHIEDGKIEGEAH